MTDSKEETVAAFRDLKARVSMLDEAGMDLLFAEARTCYAFRDKAVPNHIHIE